MTKSSYLVYFCEVGINVSCVCLLSYFPACTLTLILEKLEDKLSARSGEKPVGGIDLSGVHDQTNMAVDELFDGESELSN